MAKNSKGKRGKSKPTKKDKSGPKKPLSGFMFFSKERRLTLKEEQPGLKIIDASKVIGKEWNALDNEQKEPYAKQAALDRERYQREKAALEGGEPEQKEEPAQSEEPAQDREPVQREESAQSEERAQSPQANYEDHPVSGIDSGTSS